MGIILKKPTYEVLEYLLDSPYESLEVISEDLGRSYRSTYNSCKMLADKGLVDVLEIQRTVRPAYRYRVNTKGQDFILESIKESYHHTKSITFLKKYRTKCKYCDLCDFNCNPVFKYKNENLCLSCIIKLYFTEPYANCSECGQLNDLVISEDICEECLQDRIKEESMEFKSKVGHCHECDLISNLTCFKGKYLCNSCLNPDLSDYPVEIYARGNWDPIEELADVANDESERRKKRASKSQQGTSTTD